nr:ribosomal protein S14 [Tanacetum cinerariifolium]
MASNPENVRLTVLMKLQEALDEEAILEEQMLALMRRFADRFMDHRVEINNLIVLHDHPLIDYGTTKVDEVEGYLQDRDELLKTLRHNLLEARNRMKIDPRCKTKELRDMEVKSLRWI